MSNLYPSLDGLWPESAASNQYQTTSPITMSSFTSVTPRNKTSPVYERADSLYPSLESDQQGIIKLVEIARGIKGKIGVNIEFIQGGFFVVLCQKGLPSSLAGLKFGDQILKINDTPVNGYSLNKLSSLVKKSTGSHLTLMIKTRPLTTRISLNKDERGRLGFELDNRGRITKVLKDSPAASNGLLVDQNILEVDSRNAIGLSNLEVESLIHRSGQRVSLTLMQSRIFEMMTKDSSPQVIRANLEGTPLSI